MVGNGWRQMSLPLPLLISLLLAAVVGLPVTLVEPPPAVATVASATAATDPAAAEASDADSPAVASPAADSPDAERVRPGSPVSPAATARLARPGTVQVLADQDDRAAGTPRAPPALLG